MRILDLGAHDGFVGTWLGRHLDEQLHIDGVEANSDAVRIANDRREGNSGVYKQGLAEEARELFAPGTYDVVVAFELIEHVINVPAFLTACEDMCNVNGRVYLSTPNGTFGEGSNPHHLRVYRAIDLFELCRRRGEVEDMAVGQDGITVISYTPSRDVYKPELAIYCGPGWEKWHPTDIETKGLGGSETAAIRLATALSSRYMVTVYGECDFCAYRQVTFKPHVTFDPLEKREAVIASRSPYLVDRPLNANHRMLWMHDTDYGDGMTQQHMAQFDSIMVLSEWHKQHVMDMYGVDESRVTITGNAIEPEYFNYEELERPPVALYSSSPDRGLDLLLAIWPEVRERIPDAELHYCYSSVYDKVAAQNPAIGVFRDRILELADQPGVVNLGSLTQPELAKKMGSVRAWLAPSYSTPSSQQFYETYCIGAVEAAAAGACLVVSEWGALPERLVDAVNSVSIPAPSDGSPLIKEEWISAIVNAMTIPVYQRSYSALSTTWDRRALEFDEVIQGDLASITR